MPRRYKVEGYFEIEVEADNAQEARAKAERILQTDGIDHCIVNVEVKEE